MSWYMVNSDDKFDILDRHKKRLICDICLKRFWFWQKVLRFVIRTKENVWTEYYHIKCLEKKGVLTRVRQVKAGRWDKDEGDKPATNSVR